MTRTLQLRDITRENFDAVACLEVHEHQRGFLASNSYSIAQASFDPALRTRAIYSDGEPVGFAMYCMPEADDDEPGCYYIWRFMIDRAFQGKGYGRIAMALLLEEISGNADAFQIFISYKPENDMAKVFYASFGFVEQGIDPDNGEMVAVIDRRRNLMA